ncbi:MAG: GNAT family N-acetyltransferase [Clostridiales bacterium]|nr:GNAT family N-acetyltransferase [Clostridiales bacterium]
MIKIEKATINDAYDYAKILNQSWKDTYHEYISIDHINNEFNIENLVKAFPTIINSKNELCMIKYKGKNIGILQIGIPEDVYKSDMQDYGEILSLHIKKEYCGRGFGTLAIDFATNRLKQLGFKHLCVWVKKQNYKAINFYKSKGFVETNYSCEETIDGAPSFVMEKNNI